MRPDFRALAVAGLRWARREEGVGQEEGALGADSVWRDTECWCDFIRMSPALTQGRVASRRGGARRSLSWWSGRSSAQAAGASGYAMSVLHELVELELRGRAGAGQGGEVGGQIEVREEPGGGVQSGDCGNDGARALTARTDQNIKLENSRQELGP